MKLNSREVGPGHKGLAFDCEEIDFPVDHKKESREPTPVSHQISLAKRRLYLQSFGDERQKNDRVNVLVSDRSG